MNDYIKCFACGSKCLNIGSTTHPYMLSAPGCWEMYMEVLTKEYSDLMYWRAHQYTVDAFACQHVGLKDDRRAKNSVYIHLISLYALFELDQKSSTAPLLRTKAADFVKKETTLEYLTPPPTFGALTVYEVWNNEDGMQHYDKAKAWAKSVWDAWSHQHDRIDTLAKRLLDQ